MSDTPDTKPEKKGLKSTLNLPQTPFPMKANLPVNEPLRLKRWQEEDLYGQIRAARAGAPKYILHDGPPYANGAIHLGHALNKCIKDFVVKTKTMAGFDAPYVPGWDCHGLPIEIKVDEQLGRKKLEMDPLAVRQACREYARKYVDLQRAQFERIGVFGRWNDPYLTMSNEYESKIVESFYSFFEQGFVYKGLKPVFWCIHDRTALAEAEVEYEQHTSPSVYIRYKLTSWSSFIISDFAYDKIADKAKENVYAIIWTTTPWTIPASQAIAFHPDLQYVALATPGATYIIAQALLSEVIVHCHLMSGANPTEPASQSDVIALFPGSYLDSAGFRTRFQHPFLDREIVGVGATYVTADQGTGAVHTAPAHGVDDFFTGRRYKLPEVQYVDNAGRQSSTGSTATEPLDASIEGLSVFKSNAPIIELLREKGALLSATHFEHSYPHCWRCHNPVIVRATEQWFIGMETEMKGGTFRQRALEEIDKVVWDPAWGKERISNMIATRPDWCISRQRIWGVPIAVFLCEQCGEPLKSPEINRHIVGLFEKESADAWYKYSAEELLPEGTACPRGHTAFRKEMDILDVWFESGSSWHAVLEPEGDYPADLYTEGGDQHRGWFHSSLLTSVAMRNKAPYKMVATSGWTLDEQGRAFSKSLGNGVDPVDIAKRLGGEIIRLWVASVDFREDVAASENLMQRVSDNYRKLRNTLRFLLSNLYAFIPPPLKDVKFDAMQPLDQYILARLAQVSDLITEAYKALEFHRAYHALNEFINTDLSAFYLDLQKDRLYTYPTSFKQGKEKQEFYYRVRQSSLTAQWLVLEILTRLIAPILSFTSDEVWQLLPYIKDREPNVHLSGFFDLLLITGPYESLLKDWDLLLRFRGRVTKAIESSRTHIVFGKVAEIKVGVSPDDQQIKQLIPIVMKYGGLEYDNFLLQVLGVSGLSTKQTSKSPGMIETEAKIYVGQADGSKCDRCWRYTEDCQLDPNNDSVCARCYEALDAIDYYPINYSREVRA